MGEDACAACGQRSDSFGTPWIEDTDFPICPSCGMPVWSRSDARPQPPNRDVTRASFELFVLLAVELNDVVPEGVSLEATTMGVRINLASGGARFVEVWDDNVPAEEFAINLLGALQEEVIEEVAKTGWPPKDPAQPNAPQSGRDLPKAHAELVEGWLRCWYGDSERPSLSVTPIWLGSEPSGSRAASQP